MSRRNYSGWTVGRFKKEVKKIGATSRSDLQTKDRGLYQYGRRHGLLDVAFGEPLHRDYSGCTFEYFKQEVEKLGAGSRRDLEKKSLSLYRYAVSQKGWFDVVFGPSKNEYHRDYSNWTVERFEKEVEKLGAISRNDLKEKDCRLYQYGQRKGLLDVVFGTVKGKYSGLSLDNFVRIVEELGYSSRTDLEKKDSGFYQYARKQAGWFDAAFGSPLNSDYSGWTVGCFKEEVEKLGVNSRFDLEKTNRGLYRYAHKQDGWFDAVFGEPLRRDYAGWTIGRFKEEILKTGAVSRNELAKKDGGLYVHALEKGWLDIVFPKSRSIDSLLESFVGGSNGQA